jgi:putative hydrolase of the HAD superfamily
MSPGDEPVPGEGRFDAVLIDLWGTVLPYADESDRRENLAEMARILGADTERFTEAWIRSIGDRCLGSLGTLEETVGGFARDQGVEPTREAVARAVRCRLEFSRGSLDSAGPVLPALDALRRAGLRLAIVSDSTEETVRLWPESPLATRFDHTAFSFDLKSCKPDPRMYRSALEALAVRPSRVAYVGDGGSRELTGAEAVGLTAFMYRFPDLHQEARRFDEDVEWRGTRLTDLRKLLALNRTSRPAPSG